MKIEVSMLLSIITISLKFVERDLGDDEEIPIYCQ
jgi:hypothetical protein